MENAFLRGIVYFLAICGAGSLVFTTWFMTVLVLSVRHRMITKKSEDVKDAC